MNERALNMYLCMVHELEWAVDNKFPNIAERAYAECHGFIQALHLTHQLGAGIYTLENDRLKSLIDKARNA